MNKQNLNDKLIKFNNILQKYKNTFLKYREFSINDFNEIINKKYNLNEEELYKTLKQKFFAIYLAIKESVKDYAIINDDFEELQKLMEEIQNIYFSELKK